MAPSYVSPYGPKLRPTRLNIGGTPLRALAPIGIISGAFGAVALGTLIYIGEGIPRVQRDILQKIPVLGDYWKNREIPASDNPF